MRQVNLRLDDGLFQRVEDARGQVPRERWLRDVIEQALAGGMRPSRQPDAGRLRSSGQSKRDVKPIPKK